MTSLYIITQCFYRFYFQYTVIDMNFLRHTLVQLNAQKFQRFPSFNFVVVNLQFRMKVRYYQFYFVEKIIFGLSLRAIC